MAKIKLELSINTSEVNHPVLYCELESDGGVEDIQSKAVEAINHLKDVYKELLTFRQTLSEEAASDENPVIPDEKKISGDTNTIMATKTINTGMFQ